MSIVNLNSQSFAVQSGNVYIKNVPRQPGMLLVWADYCGHCHRFMPIFKDICKSLGAQFTCVAVENEVIQKVKGLSQALDFQYFPTIKFFDQTGKIISTYPSSEERTKANVMNYICKVYHHCAKYH